MDVVGEIRTFNAGREPERLRLKYLAMRSSPTAFLRGTCRLFYDRLPRDGVFASVPLVWVCGDLHLENFGSYKGEDRLSYFDINDFDESVLAPASWDLVRFLTSVWLGSESLSLSNDQARTLCQAFLDAYAAALGIGKAYSVQRDTAQGLVRELLDGLRDRPRAAFLEKRTTLKGRTRVLRVDGNKALPASASERALVTSFMAEFSKGQADPDFFRVLDVARRIAGTASLGIERYVILVEGKGSPDSNHLLDLKQALPSSLAPYLRVQQPQWQTEAHRIVALQRRLQAVPMAFLQPVLVGGTPFVLRGVQPTEDRIALDRPGQTLDELSDLIATMGRLVAWAQLRSAGQDGSVVAPQLGDLGTQKTWMKEILDASVVATAQVREDATAFNAAWDEGLLSQ